MLNSAGSKTNLHQHLLNLTLEIDEGTTIINLECHEPLFKIVHPSLELMKKEQHDTLKVFFNLKLFQMS